MENILKMQKIQRGNKILKIKRILNKIFKDVSPKDIYAFGQIISRDNNVDDDFVNVVYGIYREKKYRKKSVEPDSKATIFLANGRKIKITPIKQTRTFAASNTPYHQMVQGILFYNLVQKFGIESVIIETLTKYYDFPEGKNPDIIILNGRAIRCVIEIEIAQSISGNTNQKAHVYKDLRPNIPFCVAHVRDGIVKDENGNVRKETIYKIRWRTGTEDKEVENCLMACEDQIKQIDDNIFPRHKL